MGGTSSTRNVSDKYKNLVVTCLGMRSYVRSERDILKRSLKQCGVTVWTGLQFFGTAPWVGYFVNTIMNIVFHEGS
jgi:hypothetical protein